MKTRLVTCLALLAALAAASSATAQTVLRFKFEKGNKLKYVMDQNMTMNMTGPQNLKLTMNQQMEMKQAVNDVNAEGAADITQQITGMKMKMRGPGGIGFEYDSKKGGNQLQGPFAQMKDIFDALLSAKFEMKMSARGEVLDVTVPAELLKKLQANPAMQGMSEMFSKDGFKQLIMQGSPTLPEKAVQRGDKWQHKFVMKNKQLGNPEITASFTYEGKEGNLDKIAVNMKFDLSKFKPPGGIQLKVTNFDTNGYMYFNNEAGRLERSTVKQNLEMEISVGNQTIKQKMETDMVMKVSPIAG